MKINATVNYWLSVLMNGADGWNVRLGPVNKTETSYGLTIWTMSNSVDKWKGGKFFSGLVTLQATLDSGRIESTLTVNLFDGKPELTRQAPTEIVGQLLKLW